MSFFGSKLSLIFAFFLAGFGAIGLDLNYKPFSYEAFRGLGFLLAVVLGAYIYGVWASFRYFEKIEINKLENDLKEINS